MNHSFIKNKLIQIIAVISIFVVFMLLYTPTVYANNNTMSTDTDTDIEPTVPHECTWIDEKWTWSVDEEGLASYVLNLKCAECGNQSTHKNKNKIYPSRTDKTVAPTCTNPGTDFYSVEVSYDGQTFVGTYEKTIQATGHSYKNLESVKYEVSIDSHGGQYHYIKCTNSNCPDNGKVEMKNCFATGTNIATCGKKSTCDVCKNSFGDILEHEYANGICKHCKKEHTPHNWEEGICSVCAFEHQEHRWSSGECVICKFKHDQHEWDQGVCSVCRFVSDEHQWKDGVCEECKMTHSLHKWEDGICTVCLLVHQHTQWSNGKCITCNIDHEQHEWNNGVCKICNFKHTIHEFINSECDVCDVVCQHKEFSDGSCKTCGYSDYKIYVGSIYQYQLQSNGRIMFKTNVSSDTLKSVLIDGYPIDNRYVQTSNKEITIISEFLNRLSVGDHNVTLVYDNGQIETSLTIVDAQRKISESNMILLIILATVILTSIVVIILIVVYKIRNKREESMAEQYANRYSDNNITKNTGPINSYTKDDEKKL